MSWWDYGHWIETIGRRIPNANPFQQGIGGPSQGDKPGACTFLTAQNEEEANAMLDELGTKYVIIDVETAVSKYHAVATWRYGNASMFFETYWIMTERGYYEPITFYYPAYYRSMCSRLYNFEGKEVVPQNSTWVISYTEETKIISFAQLFPTYEEAKAFMDNQNQTSPNYRIVGTHPFISPVPLEGLKNYELIHQSDSTVAPFEDGRRISYVEIFEYTTESIFSSPP
jgi:dolichyl-diphosphooligosaccharide--protein glycosyltransferase